MVLKTDFPLKNKLFCDPGIFLCVKFTHTAQLKKPLKLNKKEKSRGSAIYLPWESKQTQTTKIKKLAELLISQHFVCVCVCVCVCLKKNPHRESYIQSNRPQRCD